jgi:acylphosphatase
MAAKHLIIAGRVQGVGYRDWLIACAQAAGVSGWVRNRLDGTVEALLAGETSAVEELARQCRRGPRMAVVTSIEEELGEVPAEPGFRGLPTR